ncbi:hypothetical protein F4780DRAFT_785464 [Xylariomycetidae sp. FL0641]|nr:hypothetical protein F4780DRAFT_785464 [Xylariomycetidae sp. FL0641]
MKGPSPNYSYPNVLYNTPPASQDAETYQPLPQPQQHPQHPQHHYHHHQHQHQQSHPPTPASYPPSALRTDFPACPPQLLHSSVSPVKGVWPTPPPSTIYEGEDHDGYPFISSPASGTPSLRLTNRYTTKSDAASPRSWPVSDAQHVDFAQTVYKAPDPMPQFTMGMCSPAQFEGPYSQFSPASYPPADLGLRGSMNAESVLQPGVSSIVSDMSDLESAFSTQVNSPQLPEEYVPPYQVCEDEEMQDSDAIEQSEPEENTKTNKPYAQLIAMAFKSRPNHSMTLQEIYQWFRENTDKGKSKSKGWQNSIRHNLSMNAAFVKPEVQPSPSKSQPGATETKKSTEWVLEPWAVTHGVQSTTRYRPQKAGKSSKSHDGTQTRHPARVSSGQKGGVQTSKGKSSGDKYRCAKNVSDRPKKGFLSSQREFPEGNLYNHGLGYGYTSPSAKDEPTTPPDLGVSIFRDGLPAIEAPTSCASQYYQHSQAYHSGQVQANPYNVDDIADVYGAHANSATARISGPGLPLNHNFAPLFAHPHEVSDDRGGYVGWNAGGAAY